MGPEVIFVFALITGAVILFMTEYIPFEITALLIATSLMATGILDLSEGLSGLSNQATVTIGCMFIISEGLRKAGILRAVGSLFTRAGKKNFWLAVITILLITGVVSGFMNNTAAVAIFIPVVITVSRALKVSPSKLLIPLSYISICGGVCTLIGTSTNILVNSIASDSGFRPLSMFEFLPMGIIFLAGGFIYLMLYGIRRLPDHKQEDDLSSRYEMEDNISDIELTPSYENLGCDLEDCKLTNGLDLDVLRLFKKTSPSQGAGRTQSDLEEGDIIRIRGKASEVDKIKGRDQLIVKSLPVVRDTDLEQGRDILLEVSANPNSTLIGKKLEDINLRELFGAIVLGIRHRGKKIDRNINKIRLSRGDTLLLSMERSRVPQVEGNPDFLVISKIELPVYKTGKIICAASILAGVVLAASFHLIPIALAALIGSILFIITGCLKTTEAYNAVNWKVIFLLAGILPLGIAMEKTGAAGILSGVLMRTLNPLGPRAILSGFFLITMISSNIISNQAAAVLFTPIAIYTATELGVNPRTFIFTVAFAASLNFLTPVSYPTNALVYSPGRYRFLDYSIVGGPLSIIFWILGSLLIPIIWPL
ncbi:MAG: SLC13 family permease [Candidatus Latescibacteria bacterium]|nr:SLC13 family permease [bacterium]MBD3424025.1 SLC13 family permease [Candidatus Latescibacterota bacterium]